MTAENNVIHVVCVPLLQRLMSCENSLPPSLSLNVSPSLYEISSLPVDVRPLDFRKRRGRKRLRHEGRKNSKEWKRMYSLCITRKTERSPVVGARMFCILFLYRLSHTFIHFVFLSHLILSLTFFYHSQFLLFSEF